eukprot:CAMPEP_0181095812 /NCGR_PEP_ID=MMETSP1071-20121207/10708_1 /TAXON_ID=35127 /ORGANISM="Thalassiosira sp., Strain NH16" /LENGTH=116 /DNA_ID=CAMNT_0023178197 /DNA_START=622 /DNA_END=972 /DNA_ORIENTATION=-
MPACEIVYRHDGGFFFIIFPPPPPRAIITTTAVATDEEMIDRGTDERHGLERLAQFLRAQFVRTSFGHPEEHVGNLGRSRASIDDVFAKSRRVAVGQVSDHGIGAYYAGGAGQATE